MPGSTVVSGQNSTTATCTSESASNLDYTVTACASGSTTALGADATFADCTDVAACSVDETCTSATNSQCTSCASGYTLVDNAPPTADSCTSTFPLPSEASYGGSGGGPFSNVCPAGQALTGVSGTPSSGYASAQAFRCGTLSNTGSIIAVGAGATLPALGVGTGAPYNLSCAANQVVVGVDVYTTASPNYVGGLAIYCAPLTVSGSTITRGATTRLAWVGVGGTLNTFLPPHPAVGVGQVGRSGSLLDALGIRVDDIRSILPVP